MAKFTALDERFAHQIPEPFPNVLHFHPDWRESLFFIMHEREKPGDVLILTLAHFPSREEMDSLQLGRVGDSPIMIYCDSQKVYESTAHDCENKGEIERVARRGSLSFKPSGTFEVLDDEKSLICSVQSQYFEFKGKLLAMSQALGHMNYNNPNTAYRKVVAERDGIFGIAPEKATFKFSGRQKLNVKLCSDGVGDVLNEKLLMDQVMKATANASVIAEYAKTRWTQEWNVVKKDEYLTAQGNPDAVVPSQKFTFGKGVDDISCVSWVQTEDPTM